MKPTQERTTKRTLKAAITSLQASDVLLNGVFARDSEASGNDGFPAQSTGGGKAVKGSHSDRTSDHATRDRQADPVHTEVSSIVTDIDEIRKIAARIEKTSRKLTAHERSLII